MVYFVIEKVLTSPENGWHGSLFIKCTVGMKYKGKLAGLFCFS